MGYCTASQCRMIAGLTTDDISNEQLNDIIGYATTRINSDIQVLETEEYVLQIDSEKENKINGSNTTFYTRSWPLGDNDNSGTVDTDDVLVWSFDSTGARTALTVSSIDDVTLGKFTLSAAPESNVTLRVTYSWVPLGINLNTPYKLVELACMQLSAAMAFMKVDPLILKQLDTVDGVNIPSTSKDYMRQYNETMVKLKSEILVVKQTGNIPSARIIRNINDEKYLNRR